MSKKISRRDALRLMASTSVTLLVAPDIDLASASRAASDLQTKRAEDNEKPVVYMTTDISSEGLMRIYEALGRKATGNVAVKISSGEPGENYYLHPEFIGALVEEVEGTIVECNTAYGGPRSDTETHRQVMEDHGFNAIAPTDIMDADGQMSIPIVGGKHLEEDIVGANFANYDFVVNLAHFKGHMMGGFGGVLKNMSIGIASSMGKSLIHSAGTQTTGFGMGTPQDDFLESMAEAAKGVADYMGENILYIDVMNNLMLLANSHRISFGGEKVYWRKK